jgi:hypothetical protein
MVWAALVILLLGHALGNVVWLTLDNHPVLIDEDRHMLHARNMYGALFGIAENDPSFAQRLANAYLREGDFPPLTYLYGAAAIALLGPRPDALAFSTTPLLALMLVGLFLLARRFLPPWEALFATFVASMTPLVYAFSHYYSVDYPAATAVVWVIVGLLYSDGFRRWGWSLIAGLGVAVCLMTRPPTLLCAFPALVIALGQARLAAHGLPWAARWGVVRNLLLWSAVGLAPALPWYAANWWSFLDRWLVQHNAGGAVLHFPSSTAHWGIYPFLIINLAMFLPMFLLALGGMAVLVLCRRFRSPAAWALALWPWPMYLVLTIFFQQKEVRYAFPLVPGLGLAAGVALLALPWPRVRRVACVVAAVVLLTQYGTFTAGWSGPVVHGQYARVVMVELPGVHFSQHEDDDIYYIGPNGLSLYRNAMLSDSYSYCPPYRDEHFLERLLNALIDDINRHAAHKELVGLALVSYYDQIPGLSNLEFYNPRPGEFARSRWGGGEVSKAFVDVVAISDRSGDASPESALSMDGLNEADYIIFKFEADGPALARRESLNARGWRVVSLFWGEGYGQCRPGVYLLMTRIPEADASGDA